MKLHKAEIENLENKFRLNLINSLSGVKPANLIGTKSAEGKENVAIFSSVVHLGSHPAQIGFILRPQGNSPRDTWSNISATKVYTINSVGSDFTKKAHYTSAKLEKGVSEFNRMKLTPEYIDDFGAPFVAESKLKIGMRLLDNIALPNGCTMVVGEVQLLDFEEKFMNDLGQLDLELMGLAGIGGLNSYFSLKKEAVYPYVRTNEIPDFE